jgi:hypothetical protein
LFFGMHQAKIMLIGISEINLISTIQTGTNFSLVRTYQIVILKECPFSAIKSVNSTML